MFSARSGPGLSISTSAANNSQLTFNAPSNATSSTSLSNSTDLPGTSGGMFSNLGKSTASQPSTSAFGTAFGATSQPAQSAFGSSFGGTTQPAQNTFGVSQPAQSGGLFPNASSQPTQSGGLFPNAPSNQASSSGFLFTNPSSQSTSSGGLFPKAAQPGQQTSAFASTQQTQNTSTQGAKIDADHLRPTTKYDQLTDSLQQQIAQLDEAILTQIAMCNEVRSMLPAIESSGANLPNDVVYVTQKLEEVKVGFENDAEEIAELKEKVVKKDAREAQVCFRAVDKLKMPAQYQNQYQDQSGGGVYGGSGISGWWNNPKTLQRSVRGTNGVGGSRSLPLPGDEDDDEAGAPANMVDLFGKRTEEMGTTLKNNRDLLKEIEDFVESVETKIVHRERELMDERNGNRQPEDQVRMLRYVFGAVEKSLYDVADKVGGARDGVQELIMGSVDKRSGSRLEW